MEDLFEKGYRVAASQLVVERLRVWRKLGKPAESEFDWITQHSLRTLVKQGNCQTLTLLEDRAHPKIEVEEIQLDQESLRPGDKLLF
jgi:3-methyladenine DNA glycosylase AlkC